MKNKKKLLILNLKVIGKIGLVLENTQRGLEFVPNTYAYEIEKFILQNLFNNFLFRNRILSVNYSALLTDLTQIQINVPTFQDLSRNCPQIVLGPVKLYNQFWEISACGRLDENQFKFLESALKKAWSLKFPNTQLIIDIFKNLVRFENIQ